MPKAKDWGEWQEVDRSDGFYLITANEGPAGSGKTHFMLTGPEPIAVHLFDPGGLNGLKKNPLFKKKDIRVIEYNVSLGAHDRDDRQEVAQAALEQFKEQQAIALKNGARTIGIDKEDYLWQLRRFAEFGAASDRPNNYDQINMHHQDLFHQAEMAGINLCVIRGMKPKWGDKASAGGTGEFVPRGMPQVPELVQIQLRHRYDPTAGKSGDFVTMITDKCRVGEDSKKLFFSEHVSLTLPELGVLIYPETADMEGVWE